MLLPKPPVQSQVMLLTVQLLVSAIKFVEHCMKYILHPGLVSDDTQPRTAQVGFALASVSCCLVLWQYSNPAVVYEAAGI